MVSFNVTIMAAAKAVKLSDAIFRNADICSPAPMMYYN
jgi:hypothetical protein